jgi:hypothetical protein
MIFELYSFKLIAMKKLIIIFISFIIISSCSSTKEANSSVTRSEKKIAEQALVKSAVESKKYIIKLNRLYFSRGGQVDLIPRANYIIIDGEKAIISTAYLGRQYDIKPILAINMRGKADGYALTSNVSKGTYEVKLKVENGRSNTFEVYLSIGKSGYCTVSVSSLKIESIRYAGYLEPIPGTAYSIPDQTNII